MPTNLLNVIVPDFPNNGPEICHQFSGNFLHHIHNPGLEYMLGQNALDFLFNSIHQLDMNRQNIGSQILPGDLIIIGIGRNQVNAIVQITHSMIAITPTIWFGCNNFATFGALFNNLNIPANSLFNRREIDLNAINAFFDLNTYVLGEFAFDVLRDPSFNFQN